MKAVCPLCGKTAIIITTDSRPIGNDFNVRRRRECMLCKGRFTTYETVEKGEGKNEQSK